MALEINTHLEAQARTQEDARGEEAGVDREQVAHAFEDAIHLVRSSPQIVFTQVEWFSV